MRTITIAGREVGEGCEPLIVAEVGLNHNGDLKRAVAMCYEAKKAGCDAVKFAAVKANGLCSPADPLYSAFKDAELPDDAWAILAGHCDVAEIIFFATPQNESDLALLLDVGVPCIKVGSDDLTNYALLRSYASHKLPMILSTGMADKTDVAMAYGTMRQMEVPFMLLCCTSEYPCKPESANLNRIRSMREMYDCPIGYSDHTTNAMASTVATAFGACYLERHFTLDNQLAGPDHHFSANPEQLAHWVWAIRNTRTLMGSGVIEPTPTELAQRDKWRRKSGQKLREVA